MLQIVQGYNVFSGDGYLGGLFPRKHVKHHLGFDEIYEAIRLALQYRNDKILLKALRKNCRLICVTMDFDIKENYYANSSLRDHIPYPMGKPYSTEMEDGALPPMSIDEKVELLPDQNFVESFVGGHQDIIGRACIVQADLKDKDPLVGFKFFAKELHL